MKEFRNPSNIHEPVGSYVHHIEIKGDERLLVISGQVGMTRDGAVPDDPYEQLGIAFDNIVHNLHAANMDVKDIIKINWYLVGDFDPAKRRDVILSKLDGHKPCSTLVYVAGLAAPMYRVEIEAWASRAD
ncbi:MAG TPA: RidA family protein [Anaerolineae bacterium]|nr:RidA family protein [Anaerolineae bacterium]